MADQKISQLTDGSSPQNTDEFPIARSGANYALTWAELLAGITGITEGQLTLADVTTDNVSSTKHGFAPKSPADATQFLNGAATPAFAQVKDSDLSTSDITTNNVSTSKHGFAPKAPNDATKYLDGTGAYSVPAGSGGGGTPTDGWVDDTAETWTYVSSTSFKVSGVDVTAKYSKGTRLKLTQTTVKYFVVVASSFSTDTTITITGGSDYSLANAAISANYHSYTVNPQGYPTWFNFAPSLTGFSGSPTVQVARFSVMGATCYIKLDATGTSNSTSAGFTAPISTTSQVNNDMQAVGVINNGSSLSQPGDAYLSGAGTVWGVFRDSAGTLWASSGTKAFRVYGSFEF